MYVIFRDERVNRLVRVLKKLFLFIDDMYGCNLIMLGKKLSVYVKILYKKKELSVSYIEI